MIDFDLKSKPDFIADTLKSIYKKAKTQGKNILFRNLAINFLRFMEQTEKSKDNPISKPGDIDSILSIDRDMNVLSVLAPNNKTMMDLIEYQIRLQKVFKNSKREYIL